MSKFTNLTPRSIAAGASFHKNNEQWLELQPTPDTDIRIGVFSFQIMSLSATILSWALKKCNDGSGNIFSSAFSYCRWSSIALLISNTRHSTSTSMAWDAIYENTHINFSNMKPPDIGKPLTFLSLSNCTINLYSGGKQMLSDETHIHIYITTVFWANLPIKAFISVQKGCDVIVCGWN